MILNSFYEASITLIPNKKGKLQTNFPDAYSICILYAKILNKYFQTEFNNTLKKMKLFHSRDVRIVQHMQFNKH
jgi:hypothetical protein